MSDSDIEFAHKGLKKYFGCSGKQAFKIIIIILITLFIGRFWGSSGNKNMEADIKTTIITNKPSEQLNSVGFNSNSCKPKSFDENDWLIKYYKPVNDEGFYCPKSGSPFGSPDIWYKEKIPVAFRSLTMNYQVISEKDKSTETPSLIFSLGDSPRILRFYAPHGKNPQIVGFEKVILEDPENKLEFEPPRDLSEPIKYGTPVEISIRSLLRGDNKATLAFQLQYISNSGKPAKDNFEYNIELPIPNPEGSSIIQFGFGTFKGSCIKPLDYTFCY